MAKQYSEYDLKEIGKRCGNKLPPASAVQAMFLYEMQRETELEKLFQGHMFELARLGDSSKTQRDKVSELSGELKNLRNELESQVKAIRKEMTAQEVEQRVSTSLVRTEALQQKLNQSNERIDQQAAQFVTMQEKVNELSTYIAVEQETQAKLAAMDEEITLLFEERDAMFEMLSKNTKRTENLEKDVTSLFKMVAISNEGVSTANDTMRSREAVLVTRLKQQDDRIQKLEDLVRALTAQSPSSSSPASQKLELHTTNGQSLDLAVQKGNPHVPYKKENIRVFLPGKQWMP